MPVPSPVPLDSIHRLEIVARGLSDAESTITNLTIKAVGAAGRLDEYALRLRAQRALGNLKMALEECEAIRLRLLAQHVPERERNADPIARMEQLK